jgi:hypothetical protein
MMADEIVLRGGSLSRTTVVESKRRHVVRKAVSRTQNREYGYYRWYSQMKRIQRYNALFPGLFPELIDVGTQAGGGEAYFDIAYLADAIDVKTYLFAHSPSRAEVEILHEQLWRAMTRMHSQQLHASPSALPLYFAEEVDQKLADAMADGSFSAYARQETVVYHDKPCRSLIHELDRYRHAFSTCAVRSECFTHGNITLENILYRPSTHEIAFIDPYDENVLDCVENEYSQILQCCKNWYGVINDSEVTVTGNRASSALVPPAALLHFDELFRRALDKTCTPEQRRVVAMFEISQFVRMLPFKVAAGHVDKAKYFYTLASVLLSDLHP